MSLTVDLSKTLDPSGKDIFAIIIEEHRLVEKLGQTYYQSSNAHDKQGIAHNIIKLLSIHAACEEMVLYPFMRAKLPNGPAMVQHALNEHQQLKQDLYALDNMLVGQAHYDERLSKALSETLEHVKEEETDLLPTLRSAMDQSELQKLTEEYVAAHQVAPSRPHPEAPNTPPENRHTNAVAHSEDAGRDAGRFSSAK